MKPIFNISVRVVLEWPQPNPLPLESVTLILLKRQLLSCVILQSPALPPNPQATSLQCLTLLQLQCPFGGVLATRSISLQGGFLRCVGLLLGLDMYDSTGTMRSQMLAIICTPTILTNQWE